MKGFGSSRGSASGFFTVISPSSRFISIMRLRLSSTSFLDIGRHRTTTRTHSGFFFGPSAIFQRFTFFLLSTTKTCPETDAESARARSFEVKKPRLLPARILVLSGDYRRSRLLQSCAPCYCGFVLGVQIPILYCVILILIHFCTSKFDFSNLVCESSYFGNDIQFSTLLVTVLLINQR